MAPLHLLRPVTDVALSRKLVPGIDPQYAWRGRVYEWDCVLPAMQEVYEKFGIVLYLGNVIEFRSYNIRRFNRIKPVFPSRVHVISDEPFEVTDV